MPIYRLPREFFFPPPEEAEPSGLLAIGGGLEPQRLVLAFIVKGFFLGTLKDNQFYGFLQILDLSCIQKSSICLVP